MKFHLSDYMPILFALLQIINGHKCLTEFLSPTLNCPILNSIAYSTLLPNIILPIFLAITTAIVAIYSVDIATASYMM